MSSSLIITTDIAKEHVIGLSGVLARPAILTSSEVDLGLVQLHNTVSRNIDIVNPSDKPITVRLRTRAEYATDEHLLPELWDGCTQEEKACQNRHPGRLNCTQEAFSPAFTTPADSGGILNTVVAPHSSATLGPIRFTPTTTGEYCLTFGIENNLTVLDTVSFRGAGGAGELVVEGVDMEDGHPVLDVLELTVEPGPLLAYIDARRKASTGLLSALGTSSSPSASDNDTSSGVEGAGFARYFLLRNAGSLPVKVDSISVEGLGCSVFGVTVLNCKGFTLASQEAVKFGLTFEPDSSLSRLKLDLILHPADSSAPIAFPIRIQLPHDLLPDLHSVLSDRINPWQAAGVAWCTLLVIWGCVSAYHQLTAHAQHAETPFSKDSPQLSADNGNSQADVVKSNAVSGDHEQRSRCARVLLPPAQPCVVLCTVAPAHLLVCIS